MLLDRFQVVFFILVAFINSHLSKSEILKRKRTVPIFDFEKYHTLQEIENYIKKIASMNSDIAEILVIGKTHQKRPITGLKLSSSLNVTGKKAIWLDGGNHGREWPAFHTIVYFVKELVSNYEIDQKITNYLNELVIYAFPVLNPDGFVFSQTSDDPLVRHWRKNKSPNNCTGVIGHRKDVCCDGVDLNRNYDFGFNNTNIVYSNPCSDEFQGPFPFSEPESRAIRDFFIGSRQSRAIKAVVSLHTHGQFFLLPYNDRRRNYPNDIKDLRQLALKAVWEIRSVHGTIFEIGTAADLISPASGGATDWIKKKTNIKYVYVIELPPKLSSWFAFQMKPKLLLPTAFEIWNGVCVIMDEVISEIA